MVRLTDFYHEMFTLKASEYSLLLGGCNRLQPSFLQITFKGQQVYVLMKFGRSTQNLSDYGCSLLVAVLDELLQLYRH
ncbi:hypothetical protein BH23CYA1_BH23CYA1_16770 [soil metagenome]